MKEVQSVNLTHHPPKGSAQEQKMFMQNSVLRLLYVYTYLVKTKDVDDDVAGYSVQQLAHMTGIPISVIRNDYQVIENFSIGCEEPFTYGLEEVDQIDDDYDLQPVYVMISNISEMVDQYRMLPCLGPEARLLQYYMEKYNISNIEQDPYPITEYETKLFSRDDFSVPGEIMRELMKKGILSYDIKTAAPVYRVKVGKKRTVHPRLVRPIKLTFFSATMEYYLICVEIEGGQQKLTLIPLNDIQTGVNTTAYLPLCKEMKPIEIQKEIAERIDQIIPYMWGPVIEEPTEVKVRLFDDYNGHQFEKIKKQLQHYASLPGNQLYLETVIDPDGGEKIQSLLFRGKVVDLESFARWIRSRGRSAVVYEPVELRNEIIAENQGIVRSNKEGQEL